MARVRFTKASVMVGTLVAWDVLLGGVTGVPVSESELVFLKVAWRTSVNVASESFCCIGNNSTLNLDQNREVSFQS